MAILFLGLPYLSPQIQILPRLRYFVVCYGPFARHPEMWDEWSLHV